MGSVNPIDAAFRDHKPVSNPDEQSCWMCDRVKVRVPYLNQHASGRTAYVCGTCDAPEP